ncbi:AAA family ATPase, partial [Faecalicatena contorta]|uniref:AAA family ATPase n=1 Tax=Faecalicatena contorta TaxID=39482 RepID=UPI001F160246
MLHSLELERYKCYRDKTKFEIAPLTILCGINSSGKSAIIKSLLLLMQSYENSTATNEVSFNGKYCNCGSFDDVIFNREGNSFSIENEFIISNSMDKNGNAFNHQDIVSYKELNKMYRDVCKYSIEKFRLKIQIEVVKFQDSSNPYIEGNKIQRYEIGLLACNKNIDSKEWMCSSIILNRVGETNNKDDMYIS